MHRPASDADEPRLTLTELTGATGVSVRTVRYYIAEGLLPPPSGGGPRSAYGRGHLDRLRLIGRLKAAYLPLKEIRRRLAGLDDAAVRRLLAAEEPSPAAPLAGPEPPPAADSASAYLARVLGPQPGPSRVIDPAAARRRQPEEDSMPPTPSFADAPRFYPPTALLAEPGSPPFDPFAPRTPLPLGAAVPLAASPRDDLPPPPPGDEATVEADAWRRIRLGDDVELLVREAAYGRRRELVDWLVAWARKVFG